MNRVPGLSGGRGLLLTRLLILVYFGITLPIRLIQQAEEHPEVFAPASVLIIAIFVIEFAFVIYGTRRVRPKAVPWVLVGQVLLACLPIVLFGSAWYPVVSGFVAGSLLLLLRARLAVPLMILAVAAEAVVRLLQGAETYQITYYISAGVNVSLSLFALADLSNVAQEMYATRLEFASEAAATARRRATDDLRRVLVRRLEQIQADGRLAVRELDRDPGTARSAAPAAAQTAVESLIRTARTALAEVRAVADEYRAPPPAARPPVRMTPRAGMVALVVMAFAFSAQQVFLTAGIGTGADSRRVAMAAVLAAVSFVLFSRHATTVLTGRRPTGWVWTLSAQAVFVVVPAVAFGYPFQTSEASLAAAIMLLVRPPWSWALFALCVLVPFQTDPNSPRLLEYLYDATTMAQAGLIGYSVGRLTGLVRHLEKVRRRLALMASLRERLRISKDVHDLLGLGMSTITVKAELARRLLPAEPGRAREELTELLRLATRALAEVGTITGEHRPLSLREEGETARIALTSVGAVAQLRLPSGPLPAAADAVLTTVLREAVTNVLRHATPRHCVIEVLADDTSVRLRIENDGARSDAVGVRIGHGLANLTDRLKAAGGTLDAGLDGDDRFTLLAEVPSR